MSFDPAWLRLREPADRAARDPGLLDAAAAHAAGIADPLLVDLGAGTGSTRRAFAGRLPPSARWRLVDHDPALLAFAAEGPGVSECFRADLRDVAGLPLGGARLVTASALFDLLSEPVLTALADRLAAEGVGLYAVLTYDGMMQWHPPHPLDRLVADAFDAHQRRDKGTGPALGPDAGPALARALAERGFAVRIASSPWRLGPQHSDLQRAHVEGVAAAASEMGLAEARDWLQARRAATASAGCTVGHSDMLALPRASSAQSKTTSVSSP